MEHSFFYKIFKQKMLCVCFTLTLLISTHLCYTTARATTNNSDNTTDAYSTNHSTKAPIDIDCDAYIVIDLNNGQVLYEKNADRKVYPASTTKIMTSILALESLDLESTITVSQEAILDNPVDGMNIGCLPDEQFKFKDIIKAVLLTSANECAYAVGENAAGSYDAFIEQMNKKAKEIGANSTHFVNAHGLFNKQHYTTARNMAAIARYAMVLSPASKKFCKIAEKKTYKLKPTNKRPTLNVSLSSTNELFNYPSNYYNKIIGGKTGYVKESGKNFVAAVKNADGRKMLCVIFGSTNTAIFKQTQLLLDEAYKNYPKKKKLITGDFLPTTITVDNLSKIKNELSIVTSGNLRAYVPNKKAAKKYTEVTKEYTNIQVPIKKGDVLGTMTVKYNGQYVGQIELLSDTDIPYDYSGYIRTILIIYIIITLLFIGGLICLAFLSKTRHLVVDTNNAQKAENNNNNNNHISNTIESSIRRKKQLSAAERASERIRAQAELRRNKSQNND